MTSKRIRYASIKIEVPLEYLTGHGEEPESEGWDLALEDTYWRFKEMPEPDEDDTHLSVATHELVWLWPWGVEYWKPKDPLTNLVRAGALVAAAIDRYLEDNPDVV